MKRLSVILFLLCGFVKAQLTTDILLTPTQLVEDVLVGSGVEVSNITFVGESRSIGRFDGSASNVGISEGIILSTGTVLDETSGGRKNGPVGPNNGVMRNDWGNPGDPDLTTLISRPTFDAAILEFDFVPQGDTVEFNYVFASDEYPDEWKGGFFDVFAFFLSGPSIAGVKNLAVIPSTTDPISANSINDITNTHLYISNGSGSNPAHPTYTDNTVTNFNGFTIPLKAVSKVTPCETYHLKIAIADVGDGDYDTGVFLEGGSLNSNPRYNIDKSNTVDVGTPFLLPEGCSDGVLKITREEDVWAPLSIDYRIMGSATNGSDYSNLTGTINFAANEDEKDILIVPLADGLAEGNETVILKFPDPNVCKTDSIEYEFTISELDGMTSTPDSVELSCPGEEVDIDANFSGGYGPYTYSWDNGDNTVTSTVDPLVTSDFEFTVEDVCGTTTTNDFKVKVPLFPALDLVMPNDTTVICAGALVNFSPMASGGAGGYRYEWSSGETSRAISPAISGSETFDLTVTDQCGIDHTESVDVTLNYPAFNVDILKDTTVCPGDSVEFVAVPSGGIAPYSFVWENFDNDSASTFASNETKFVKVSVTDSCGIIPARDSVKLTVQKPRASFIYSEILETGQTIYFYENSTGDIVDYEWDLGNGESSDERNPYTIFNEDSLYTVTLSVTDSLGCKDSTFRQLRILPPLHFFVPNAFTPSSDGDIVNNEFLPKGVGIASYELRIFNRWGNQVFFTKDINQGWDGMTPAGKEAPMDVYVYTVKLIGKNGRDLEKMGAVSLIR